MGVRLEDLPLRAQQQAVKKLAEQQRQKLEAAQQKAPSKYHNEKAERGGLKFDSRKEARRYDELAVMLQAGEIRDLKLQPQFTLQESFITPEGVRVRAIRYTADFSYKKRPDYWRGYEEQCPDDAWKLVVEDVKSRATRTKDYQMRKKLMQERLGICITEI